MTFKFPQILALDFDGVLCDGLVEYFESAWRTYCQVWPSSSPALPETLADPFYRLRPVIETGWEMPVLLRALLKGFSEAEILANWSTTCRQIVTEENLSPEDLGVKLDTIRDEWIAADLEGWLRVHRFYPGVVDNLRRWLQTPVSVFIVTTKEGRFVQQLLRQEGIQLPRDRILGKEGQRPKPETLRTLNAAPTWFVEDRLPALQAVARHTDLDEIGLFLAAWGYNTPADQAIARQDPRIQLLSLAQFTQDFSAWLQPRPSGSS